MQESGTLARFFLSANTPQGFLSTFDRLYNAKDGWRAYILTGGPGTGKSTLIKNVGEAFEAQGFDVEYIQSCFYNSCVDAVAIHSIKTCLIDGDQGNIKLEYPGVSETFINLGDFWDEKKLIPSRDKIMMFTARIASSNERADRFLAAASGIITDTCRLVLEHMDLARLETYAAHLAKRDFPDNDHQGVETQRFLTAISPDGLVSLFDYLPSIYNRIYVIEDEYGVGRLLISKLRSAALSSGNDVISCPCPIFPDGKPEHLLIPGISTAFITSGPYHRYTGSAFRHIHIRRFLDREAIKLKKQRISFNRKAARELINEAVLLLADARSSYDMIKSFYTEAMDFDAVDKLTQSLIDKISKPL